MARQLGSLASDEGRKHGDGPPGCQARGAGRRPVLAATIDDPWQEVDAETPTRPMVPAAALRTAEP
jgi:hypothetical protein